MSVSPFAFALAFALTTVVAGPKTKSPPKTTPTLPSTPVKPRAPIRPISPVKPLPPPKTVPRVDPSKVCKGAPLLRVSSKGKARSRGALPTIAAAAARARSKNYCRLRVRLGPGTHPDTSTVTLDRPTEIDGPSRGHAKVRTAIKVRTGVSLDIDKVTFDRPPGPAVDVRHPNAKTKLVRVSVQHAPEYAIFIEGGELRARGLTLSNTKTGTDLLSGAGLRIGRGAVAQIDGLLTNANGAHDIVVVGAGTDVTAQNIHLIETKHHPRALAEAQGNPSFSKAGAVMVGDGAKLLADRIHVTSIDLAAVMVYGGSKARLRRLKVRDVRSRTGTDGNSYGGTGISSVNGSVVELEDFRVHQAALVGLRLYRAYMTARNGRVTSSPIGVSVDLEGLRSDYGIFCLEDRVRYTGNTVNLDSTEQFVPETILPGSPAPPRFCPSVN